MSKTMMMRELKAVIEHDCAMPILLVVNKNINMDEVYDKCSEDDRDNYGLESLTNPKALKLITMATNTIHGMYHINLASVMENAMGGVFLKDSDELVLFGGGYSLEDQVKNMLAQWLDVSPNIFKIKKLSNL